MKYVCVFCGEPASKCTCAYHSFANIDDDLVELISTLNSHGFLTSACCQGHDGDVERAVYIMFSHPTPALQELFQALYDVFPVSIEKHRLVRRLYHDPLYMYTFIDSFLAILTNRYETDKNVLSEMNQIASYSKRHL